ncbi:hypothetical protein [Ruficoccus sp. ZRK36]|uniref:hypothetical protein n=1 Tax=Ruficoccus sp. ZRK36 TaxID=2866311 RepID=UPI001C7356DD|nr:hypothetical protein [Ruficoccus sp. ZRK36]QYY35264.1 hypothetical protein K0V07_13305 [Ruficoccus sp. ZRK36]
MKLVYCLSLLLLVSSCTPSGREHNDKLDLKIHKADQHPYLKDHKRILVVALAGDTIGSIELYSDPGGGASFYYIRADDGITGIDANGMWYEITKNGIKPLSWHWMTPLPMGKAYRIVANKSGNYITEEVDHVDLSDVYAYKDPPESES